MTRRPIEAEAAVTADRRAAFRAVTPRYDTVIAGATVIDGSGADAFTADVALADGTITAIADAGTLNLSAARAQVDARGLILAPGFIDVHTHDDIVVIDRPTMTPKLTQGVTTVIVGNCGISAAPICLRDGAAPDPMNLLGDAAAFRYPDFASYAAAVEAARPAVNVAALVGHTALRATHMDSLNQAATDDEIGAMRRDLEAALAAGAIGLSTGLAYASANAAPAAEVEALAGLLTAAGAIYCTHLRTEADGIADALAEAFAVGRATGAPVIVSHLKCAGVANHARSGEILALLDEERRTRAVGCDCYPYAASSSTLDLGQVTDAYDIRITWSTPHPEMGGRLLTEIAADWNLPLIEAARRLQPGGAIYHCMRDDDVDAILHHPATVIGSDGLPCDPRPHPRLWGSFPRVLGHYVRDRGLLSLTQAVRKMTGQSADRYGLRGRGYVRVGGHADLVLFDADTIADAATFAAPDVPATGIRRLWVNGRLSLVDGRPTGARAGRFLPRSPAEAHDPARF